MEEKEETIVKRSKLLRESAHLAELADMASPSDNAILDAYPGIKATNGFFSKLFNKAANERLEQEFEARDRRDYKATGTTAALKISQDPKLKEDDQIYKATLQGVMMGRISVRKP